MRIRILFPTHSIVGNKIYCLHIASSAHLEYGDRRAIRSTMPESVTNLATIPRRDITSSHDSLELTLYQYFNCYVQRFFDQKFGKFGFERLFCLRSRLILSKSENDSQNWEFSKIRVKYSQASVAVFSKNVPLHIISMNCLLSLNSDSKKNPMRRYSSNP